MADISKIELPDGTTYDIKDSTARTNSGVTGVKGNAESSYRKGNVNLTAENVQAIRINSQGNTQQLLRPNHLNGLNDNTLDSKVNTLRANRLAFLPADQIIIEKTTDGGVTWVDAGIPDYIKTGLFSETRHTVQIPLLNGVKSLKCGIRITFTAMKYNVPDGTAETEKYNYWNSTYVKSCERYNQLKEMYFWVSTNSDTVSIKLERASGANSTNWGTAFQDASWGATGWSGCDYIRFSQGVFGGATSQTSNYWNYRLTFMTRGVGGGTEMATTYTTAIQTIAEIRGYGDTWWTAGNEYAANDKIYTHDYMQNVTFPQKVTARNGFSGSLTGNVTGNVSGTASNVTGTVAVEHGGTGQTTARNAANAFMNALEGGSSVPVDADYYISQYVGGGTTTTTYHRRPMSALWSYIKGKIESIVLSSSTHSTSTTTAATSSAVKEAYDLADTANTASVQLAEQLDQALVFNTTYEITGSTATFTAKVYNCGEDVTSDFSAACFTWWKRTSEGMTQYQTTGPTFAVNVSTLGYGATILARFNSEGGNT